MSSIRLQNEHVPVLEIIDHVIGAVWPYLAKICHLGNILKVFGICIRVYFISVKIWNFFGNMLVIGEYFIVINGQNIEQII